MGKVDDHRAALTGLSGLADWLAYLSANSGLPGPRGNLELVAACGEEADLDRAEALVATGDEFATVCGLVALGRLFGEGDDHQAGVLHAHAADERWRVREGVAMALQRGRRRPRACLRDCRAMGRRPGPAGAAGGGGRGVRAPPPRRRAVRPPRPRLGRAGDRRPGQAAARRAPPPTGAHAAPVPRLRLERRGGGAPKRGAPGLPPPRGARRDRPGPGVDRAANAKKKRLQRVLEAQP